LGSRKSLISETVSTVLREDRSHSPIRGPRVDKPLKRFAECQSAEPQAKACGE
jgi:hypothetical protein